MARIISLCSSSKGNSVYIGNKSSGLLIDVGCSFKKLRILLAQADIPLEAVKAILITHEHSDHTKGLFQITKQTEIPIFASQGTLEHIIKKGMVFNFANLYGLEELSNIPLDYEIKYFSTPHDAAESVGYILNDIHGKKITYCTDLGTVTNTVFNNVMGSDTVFIESNYEPSILKNNPKYPYSLKKRIMSNIGHLSNQDSADFIKQLILNGTTRVILGHLSVENNRPSLAFDNLVSSLSEINMSLGSDYLLNIAPVVFDENMVRNSSIIS